MHLSFSHFVVHSGAHPFSELRWLTSPNSFVFVLDMHAGPGSPKEYNNFRMDLNNRMLYSFENMCKKHINRHLLLINRTRLQERLGSGAKV